MLISVVIPYRNQPEYLALCLQSLVAQTMERAQFEIIVVDNGSDALPHRACAAHGAKLLQEAEPGPGPARNRGIKAAQGEIIALIDADCVADRNWLTVIQHALQGTSREVIGGDVRIRYEDPSHLTALEAYESVFAFRQKEYISKEGYSGTGNLAFNKAVFAKVGAFAGIGIAEDRDWGKRAGALGFRTCYVPEMIVYHPARKSISELREKWRRHLIHEHSISQGSRAARLKWLAKTAVMPISPIPALWRVARSDRVRGLQNRLKAARVLASIRFFRFRAMAQLTASGSPADVDWNSAKRGQP